MLREGGFMIHRHQQVLIKAVLWLTAEVFLNFVGLDDLADYSEYLFERNAMVLQA
jgi:hypothetical protein